MQQVLDSGELDRLLAQALSSPGVRAALAKQGSGLASEVATGLRARLVEFDDRKERLVHRGFRRANRRPAGMAPFAGLATRTTAFAADLALAQVIFLIGAALLALVGSLVGTIRPTWLVALIVGSAWTLTVSGYFIFFWTIAGRTPGMHVLHLRVTTRAGAPLSFGRSLLRFCALCLSIVIFFIGILTILFDGRRRGLHDILAGTVVVNDDAAPRLGDRGAPLTIDAVPTRSAR